MTVKAIRRVLVVVLATVVIANTSSAMARSDVRPRPGRPTAELIDRAERRGVISARQAFELRVRALRNLALPAAFRSTTRSDGTMALLQAQAYAQKAGEDSSPRAILGLSPSTTTCIEGAPFAGSPQLRQLETAHFVFQYTTKLIGGGLTVRDYARAFEASWDAEVVRDGWAPPPPPTHDALGGKYLVVIDATVAPVFYGYAVATGVVGDNPATPWNEGDAQSSCVVIQADMSQVSSSPLKAMFATAAHEFNHSLQYGLGVLHSRVPDSVFVEGGATWIEDEVFDEVNDNYNYLWPDVGPSMAEYDDNIYGYWVVFRGLSERLGPNGRTMMRRFWELVSQRKAQNVNALVAALREQGLEMGPAFHDAIISLTTVRSCGGGYKLPHCFEEAQGYRDRRGVRFYDGSVTRGEGYDGTVADDLGSKRLWLPSTGAPYGVRIKNTSLGGVLRVSAVCDTGSALRIIPLGTTLRAGADATTPTINPAGCQLVRLVVTNESIAPGNPTTVAERPFTVSIV